MINVYVDGSCSPNPGRGGWAVVVVRDNDVQLEMSGFVPDTTNNRCELLAVVMALNLLRDKYPGQQAVIYTDSNYIASGLNDWIVGWKAHNWHTSTGSPVKNRDLWEQLELPSCVDVRWVKGHALNKWNNYADQLAVAARS